VIGDDHDVATVLTKYILEHYKGKRIAVIDDRTAYGQSFSDDVVKMLKTQGVEVVGREYGTAQTIDFRGALTSLKSTRPGVVVYAEVDAQAGSIRKQMTALGMGDVVLAGCAIETQQFITLARGPATAEGTLSSESGYSLADMPKGKDFVNRFAKYGPTVLFFAVCVRCHLGAYQSHANRWLNQP
jgi:branched-chain amino acid transport system substrate-binding protein